MANGWNNYYDEEGFDEQIGDYYYYYGYETNSIENDDYSWGEPVSYCPWKWASGEAWKRFYLYYKQPPPP